MSDNEKVAKLVLARKIFVVFWAFLFVVPMILFVIVFPTIKEESVIPLIQKFQPFFIGGLLYFIPYISLESWKIRKAKKAAESSIESIMNA